MKRRSKSFTTQYVLAVGLLMLAANILLGLVSLRQTEASMRSLIDKNMLDLVNSAGRLMDVDALEAMTAADVGGETYNGIIERLNAFMENESIHFVYVVKPDGPNRFTFVVDADPVEPADFGEEIIITDALLQAAKGVAAVDRLPAEDRWGNFYTAYSPVLDSAGGVGAIVGIGFDAAWYEAQVRKHTLFLALTILLTLLAGGAVVFLITHRVRRRFAELDAEFSKLSGSIDELNMEMGAYAGQTLDAEPENGEDDIEKLARKINAMQRDMGLYLDHLHAQAYIDGLTQVGNSTAYHDHTGKLDALIGRGQAAFSLALFDVNSLKEINDNLGHEYGDRVIVAAAEAIAAAFDRGAIYRIGGDEFAVVKDRISERDLSAVELAIRDFNAASTGVTLSMSMGVAHFSAADVSFKQVFARADQAMYQDKKHYYETIGNRRARRSEV